MAEETDPETQETPAEPIRIKKYPNRRLYNTATSSYIVLDDIVDLIKKGEEFVIEDTKTGEDLTRSILNQVIYERESANSDYHFPLDVQKQLILMYDDAYGKMVPEYLRESMGLFFSEREKMNSAFGEIVSRNSQNMSQLSEQLAEQNMQFFKRSFDFFQAMSGMNNSQKAEKTQDDTPEDQENNSDQLKDIQDQINALQAKLKSIG